MPVAASPSQYICNMLEDMDQDNNLQPPLLIDRPVEGYSECTNSYGQQSNFDIEDFISESVPNDFSRRHCGNIADYNSGYVNFIQNSRQNEFTQERTDFAGVPFSDGNNRVPSELASTYINADEHVRSGGSPECKNVYPHPLQMHHFVQQSDREYTPYHLLERKEKSAYTEPEFDQWTNKHPEAWNTKEVLDWIFHSAQKNHVDCGLLRAENFRSVTGADLCKMGVDDFKRLEQNYGKMFYDLFRNLCEGIRYAQSAPQPSQCMDIESLATATHRHVPSHMNSESSHLEAYSQPEYCKRDVKSEPSTDGAFYELQHIQSPYECRPLSQAHYIHPAQHHIPTSVQNCPNYPNPFMYSDFNNPHHMAARQCSMPEDVVPPQIPRRRPGRPRIKSLPTEEELQREKKVKNQHLWEFIYEILMNPLYNPQFVRWENQREGVFRFVQSEAVAQLWGGLKNNENMTYEKLSRAMRHYYKRGILERVEGRRLVYKFSRVAMDRVREKRYSV